MTDKLRKRTILVDGREFVSLVSAAPAFGLSRNTVDYRLSKGWTPEEACGLKPRPSHAASTPGIPVKVQGREFNNIKDAAKYFGRSYTHIFARLKEGCTIELALGLVKRTDSFQSEYPKLAKQWHPAKNASLTASDVTPNSGQKVWWLCQHDHEWKAVINSRTRGHGCPYCAGQKPTADRNVATEYPELLAEWDWDKNSPKKPEDLTPRSKYKVWWKCEKLVLGGAVYSAVFAAVGSWFKRPVLIGLGYAFAIEGFLANLPGTSQRVTLQYYLKSFLIDEDPDLAARYADNLVEVVVVPADEAVRTLLIIGATALALGSWILSKRQVVLPS